MSRIVGLLCSCWHKFQCLGGTIEWLREKLHFQVSVAIVGILGGLVGAVLMAAGAYILAEICFAVSGIVLGLSAASWRVRPVLRLAGTLGIFAFASYFVAIVDNARSARDAEIRRAKLDANFGTLEPGEDPNPADNKCTTRHQDRPLTIYFGGNTVIPTAFPLVPVHAYGKNFFVVDRSPAGAITLSVDIIDALGKVLATIDSNAFRVNSNNIFYKERPDESTLVVVDQYKNKVLSVRYNNLRHMTITGILDFGAIKLRADGGVSIGPFNEKEGCHFGQPGLGVWAIR